jgi:hypothetical protein
MHRLFVAVLALDVLIAGSSVFAGQQPSASPNQAAASKRAGTSATPRTPWGDPVLQGLWPSIDMQGTPLERPASFGAGRCSLTRNAAREETSPVVQADAGRRRLGRGGAGPPPLGDTASRRARPSSSSIRRMGDCLMTRETSSARRRSTSTFLLTSPDAVDARVRAALPIFGPYDRCSLEHLASMLDGLQHGHQISGFRARRHS